MDSIRRWFVLEKNVVNGPYQTSEVEALTPNAKDRLIWGRGLSEWLPTDAWQEALKNPTLLTAIAPDERQWRYRFEGKEFGPVSFKTMMDVLKSKADFTDFSTKNTDNLTD